MFPTGSYSHRSVRPRVGHSCTVSDSELCVSASRRRRGCCRMYAACSVDAPPTAATPSSSYHVSTRAPIHYNILRLTDYMLTSSYPTDPHAKFPSLFLDTLYPVLVVVRLVAGPYRHHTAHCSVIDASARNRQTLCPNYSVRSDVRYPIQLFQSYVYITQMC